MNPTNQQAGERLTVAVCASDDVAGYILGETFAGAGMTVVTASGGIELLELADRPDAFVVALPVADITAAELIPRLRDGYGWTPAVVVTGPSPNPDTQAAVYDAGADAYLPLPTSPRLLRAAVAAQTRRAWKLGRRR